MSDKAGLFDSDDEDDIQYNPDEGNDHEPVSTSYTSSGTAVPQPTSATPVYQGEPEEEKIETAPAPTPARANIPIPKPTPAASPSGGYEAADEDPAFVVCDPVNTGHVSYTIRGRDEDGEFEGSRRYNDFHHLRAALQNRWPGTFIPPIPAKKAVGNKDDKYIEYRRHFLQRFLRKVGSQSHLLNSDEFKLFARPSGEIEKMLAMMPRLTPDAIVQRYKHGLNVDEFPDEFLVKQCREVINDFSAFCKKILTTLKVVKEQASKMVPVKEQQNSNYKALMEGMTKFEEEGLAQYVDSNYNKFVVGDPSSPELKTECAEMADSLSNPFGDFHNWIIGEITDIESLQEAIKGRDNILGIKNKILSKKRTDTEELEKLNQGKKTMKTLFKSASGKQAKITVLSSNISQAEKDIEEYDKLTKMVEVHLGETVIPTFKETQMKAYYQICQGVACAEIEDSNKTAKFWANFLENPNIKNL
jgi:hypothetical protein